MTSKLIGVATLFAAGSILVAGTPTLGATSLDTHNSATSQLRCGGSGGGRRCGGGTPRCSRVPRCGGGIPRCGGGIPRCASIPRCGHMCAVRTCASALRK